MDPMRGSIEELEAEIQRVGDEINEVGHEIKRLRRHQYQLIERSRKLRTDLREARIAACFPHLLEEAEEEYFSSDSDLPIEGEVEKPPIRYFNCTRCEFEFAMDPNIEADVRRYEELTRSLTKSASKS